MLNIKMKRTGNRNISVFASLLISSVYIMLVPIAAVILVTVSSQMTIDNQADKSRQDYCQNINEKVESIFAAASSLAYEISTDNKVMAYAKSSSKDYWTEYEIINYLHNCIGSNGDFETCYIYLPQYDYVISNQYSVNSHNFYKEYYKFGYEKWLEGLDVNNTTLSIKHWLQNDSEENSYSYVIKAISFNTISSKPAVVVVQISDKALSQKIRNMKYESSDEVFICNKEEIILSTLDHNDYPVLRDKLIGNGSLEPQTIELKNKTYHVIKSKTNRFNFTSVYAIPTSSFYTNLIHTKSLAVFIITLCLTLTVVYCITFSRRHSEKTKRILSLINIGSTPSSHSGVSGNDLKGSDRASIREYAEIEAFVKEYINNYTALTKDINKQKDELQTVYLEKLLLGNEKDNKNIGKYINQYSIKMSGEYYAVAIYTASDNNQPSSENENDGCGCEDIAKTILSETINRQILPDEAFYILKFNNYLTCIFNFPERTIEQRRADLCSIIEESARILNNIQTIKFDAFVSRIHSGADKLRDAYAEVLKAVTSGGICQNDSDTVKIYPEWIDQCMEIIKQNYHDINLSTSYIAERLNLARSYLSSSFKQYTGTGLHDAILNYRILMAKKMLQDNPDIRIMDVANKTGFNNVASFIRSFKKLEGITPGELKSIKN